MFHKGAFVMPKCACMWGYLLNYIYMFIARMMTCYIANMSIQLYLKSKTMINLREWRCPVCLFYLPYFCIKIQLSLSANGWTFEETDNCLGIFNGMCCFKTFFARSGVMQFVMTVSTFIILNLTFPQFFVEPLDGCKTVLVRWGVFAFACTFGETVNGLTV